MIKRTLYFGNPAYLSTKNDQLVVDIPKGKDVEANTVTIPIEDIGVVVLDNYQITITQGVIERLLQNNVALISCSSSHIPVGLMFNLAGNTIQTELFREQLSASEPLKKQLWQQTVMVKIQNQANILSCTQNGMNIRNMRYWAEEVKSGDADNHEARAAAYYWENLFPQIDNFRRERGGLPPNNLLNYGYAILRAIIARALVGSGLLPTMGIFHKNRYNAYCLADDIMEPYRPFVDRLVFDIVNDGEDFTELSKSIKARLLTIPTLDVVIGGRRSPLMIAATQTSASLSKCFTGELRKIAYPEVV